MDFENMMMCFCSVPSPSPQFTNIQLFDYVLGFGDSIIYIVLSFTR